MDFWTWNSWLELRLGTTHYAYVMHTSHDPHAHRPSSPTWLPTVSLAIVHLLIALSFAVMVFTGTAPAILAILGMAIFGGVAIVFALLTVTTLKP